MACFLVPTGEAIVVSLLRLALKKKEERAEVQPDSLASSASLVSPTSPARLVSPGVRKLRRRLRWLSHMLWGGSALLAFEHLWHGEIVPWFPFLTAASDPESAGVMLHEMATAGVMMALLTTVAWGLMCLAASAIEKRSLQQLSADSSGGAQ
ncbi:MAG: hypothetical protein MSC43_00635 [Clostridiales bacterium]|nr:hypothetical protein [Clostridiales bacterium]MDD7432429.1 hypothetical protein [Clostridiales bacterium]MDY3061863.1 hypothetical protein [Eubacteriales bacterium]